MPNFADEMRINELITRYWRWLFTAIFAVAVFCFWLFRMPFLMLAREQSQLFLWDTEYLIERLSIPGGLAQWLGEFIVQFFINPTYGACWYAVVFVVIVLITSRLFKVKSQYMFLLCFVPSLVLWCLACDPDIPMTPIVAVLLTMLMMAILPKKPIVGIITSAILIPIGYWLLGPAIGLLALYSFHWLSCDIPKLKVSASAIALIVLLGLCIWTSSWLSPYPLRQLVRGVDYYWEGNKAGTYEEMEYDMLIRQQNWSAIAGKYDMKSSESLAVRNSAQLAFYNLQRTSKVDLLEHMILSGQTLKSISSAFLMSEVGLQIGMINVSQRSAFEAMEAIPNHNKSARALRRLVETNIVTRNYEVALKYIAILEKTTFYRSWAQRMRPLAEHPDQIKNNLNYQRLQDAYDKGKDMFFY